MTRDRLALLLTSSALLVSWLSVPASPTPGTAPPRPATPAVASPPDRAVELAGEVARETDRLGQRLAEAPRPSRRGRDPFAVAPIAAPTPARRLRHLPPPVEALPADGAPIGSPLALRLIGIAERHAGETVQRTAILSGQSDVYIVTTGDQVLGRFAVVAVGADAVELRETATDLLVRLALPR